MPRRRARPRRLSSLRATNPVATANKPGRRKPAGWTTLSGRGSAHQAERERQLAAFTEGTPCPFGEGYCGHAPMYSWQDLDLDEFPPRAIARGGRQVRRLSHASCNRKAGARLGNMLRRGGKPVRSRGAEARQTAQTQRRARW